MFLARPNAYSPLPGRTHFVLYKVYHRRAFLTARAGGLARAVGYLPSSESGGNFRCGSCWYQKATEAMSSSSCR